LALRTIAGQAGASRQRHWYCVPGSAARNTARTGHDQNALLRPSWRNRPPGRTGSRPPPRQWTPVPSWARPAKLSEAGR